LKTVHAQLFRFEILELSRNIHDQREKPCQAIFIIHIGFRYEMSLKLPDVNFLMQAFKTMKDILTQKIVIKILANAPLRVCSDTIHE